MAHIYPLHIDHRKFGLEFLDHLLSKENVELVVIQEADSPRVVILSSHRFIESHVYEGFYLRLSDRFVGYTCIILHKLIRKIVVEELTHGGHPIMVSIAELFWIA